MVAIAVVFAGLLLARLVGLALALVVARHERLRLRRNEAGLLAEMRKILSFILAILRRHLVFGAGLRLVLAELLLRRCDQAEIVFGVLVVVFCRDCVAALGFSLGERQIPFIVSSRVVRAVLFGAGEIQ